jgi:O-antigen ligase
MLNQLSENTAARIILFGAPFATIFLLTGTVTDPVNAPKLLISGAVGFSLFFIFLCFNLKTSYRENKFFILAVLFFLGSALNSVIQSEAPMTQLLYGTYGRNTGFVAYLVLSFIALGVLTLRTRASFKSIIFGMQIAGLVNVIYCGWVLVFGDFLSWSNPYGNILGLFGNPNFISAFLGIFVSSLAAYSFAPGMSYIYRSASLSVGILGFYEIYRSHAIQGLLVTFSGLGIVFFYVLRSRFKNQLVSTIYLLIFGLISAVAILGALQRGPLEFIYKRSVSLRGIYWQTAINMGVEHPFSGVGLDTYGDWYRRARPLKALTEPGIDTTSNAAHNVILDFFANGGWPLLISYLAMVGFGFVAVLRVTFRQRNYDGIFVTLAVAWACYQLQSIISINQIGLALWGWLLTGALVTYERITREGPQVQKSTNPAIRRKSKSGMNNAISPQLVGGIGAIIGLLVSCPPISADSKWRSALEAQDAKRAMDAITSGYLTPANSQRYAQAVQLFANSNLLEQAHQIAIDAVKYNPDDYQSWRNLYFLQNSTENEKETAVQNLQRLDPFNPDVTKP